jgi:hypothetical protein
LGDFRVSIHIVIIVEVDESVLPGLAEHGPTDCRQKEADAQNHPAIV